MGTKKNRRDEKGTAIFISFSLMFCSLWVEDETSDDVHCKDTHFLAIPNELLAKKDEI